MMVMHDSMTMITAQVVEKSVINNSLSKDFPHPDDLAKQITDTPGFKPFTMFKHVFSVSSHYLPLTADK